MKSTMAGRKLRHFYSGIKQKQPKNSPPLQGEARSGRVPTQNTDAFCVGPGGGSGVSDMAIHSKFYTKE